jgi:hypothetical protein
MISLRYLQAKKTLTRRYIVNLRDTIITSCECKFSEYVLSDKYKNGRFYSIILHQDSDIPVFFTVNGEGFASALLDKNPNMH